MSVCSRYGIVAGCSSGWQFGSVCLLKKSQNFANLTVEEIQNQALPKAMQSE